MNLNHPYYWALFIGGVLILLMLDLGVFHREQHKITLREALIWCIVWVSLALLFNLFLLWIKGPKIALEFFTGYLIEESLSVDNIFVFIVLLSYFRVPEELQHRVLFWGILGAILMRASLILLGHALLTRYHWILYVFGGFLLITGIRLFSHKNDDYDPNANPLFRVLSRFLPIQKEYSNGNFFVRESGKLVATPLALVLIMIETTDLVFAFDSIPAIFGITSNPFIIFTSNIFAILGLRSLYFLLAGVMGMFRYLQYGLAMVLMFIGTKMLVTSIDIHIPILVSLAVVFIILAGAIALSLLASQRERVDPRLT